MEGVPNTTELLSDTENRWLFLDVADQHIRGPSL